MLMKERYDTKESRKAYYRSKYDTKKKVQPDEHEQHVLGLGRDRRLASSHRRGLETMMLGIDDWVDMPINELSGPSQFLLRPSARLSGGRRSTRRPRSTVSTTRATTF